MCLEIWAHYSLIKMRSNIGTPKIINFPFGTNGKLMVLGVPIFKHFRVIQLHASCLSLNICHILCPKTFSKTRESAHKNFYLSPIASETYVYKLHLHPDTGILPYFFGCKTEFFFLFQNNHKDLDPSCKTDLDPCDCSGRVKLVL